MGGLYLPTYPCYRTYQIEGRDRDPWTPGRSRPGQRGLNLVRSVADFRGWTRTASALQYPTRRESPVLSIVDLTPPDAYEVEWEPPCLSN